MLDVKADPMISDNDNDSIWTDFVCRTCALAIFMIGVAIPVAFKLFL
ncbi:hypothetical protein ACTJJ7_04175 [Phyllobacterium sp. 22229]|nr:hypothetical protein [Phyllobacterium myrsinacearum]PWV90706.1 hypothetical protein DEV92_10649 [Phyllobacterium myrsinacearum]RZS88492.1 hypothetical protein EV217_0878 [Phyllobacterium myrsinacearum]RZU97107.1 hypothetical protein EV654_4685 [Phyllobacterium myrsinacearum]